MLISGILFALALAVALATTPIYGWIAGSRYRSAVVGPAVLTGYFCGGAIAWALVPAEWELSFQETLAAAVDAATYGHPVEHYAECVVVMMLAGCVAGAMLAGVLAGTAQRVYRRSHA